MDTPRRLQYQQLEPYVRTYNCINNNDNLIRYSFIMMIYGLIIFNVFFMITVIFNTENYTNNNNITNLIEDNQIYFANCSCDKCTYNIKISWSIFAIEIYISIVYLFLIYFHTSIVTYAIKMIVNVVLLICEILLLTSVFRDKHKSIHLCGSSSVDYWVTQGLITCIFCGYYLFYNCIAFAF